jgi:hypothetical protein
LIDRAASDVVNRVTVRSCSVRRMSLKNEINELATTFAHDLLKALRGASLEDIISETRPGHVKRAPSPTRATRARGGRLARRTAKDIEKLAEQIVALVISNEDGINAESLRAALKVERKELPRPLAMALSSKKIRKRGVKRATTYFKG